tara:strand:+ start:208 stop:606 length:399 start_codon:yes stop_codon:yes gene_type:complete
MFANFDYTNFPIVHIRFNETIENDNDFNYFLKEWKSLNEKRENYELVFDTQNCGFINPKYCIYMAFFIKKLKKEKIKYLQKSKIFVYNSYILKLLKLIFYFETPIAPVELILKNNDNNDNTNNIEKREIINI